MKIIHFVDIAATPDRVHAVLCDVERWPEWTATTKQVVRTDTGTFGVGSRARVFQPKLKSATFTVSELIPGRGFAWATRGVGLVMQAGHAVEPTTVGSRVTLSFQVSGWLKRVVRIFYGALIDAHLSVEARGLKTRCESPAPQWNMH